ncbi:hypothetical protein WJX74_010891 [Apatococcus lobatus]|uniref:Dienelactone hydrolase domain-containing protein n=1 Tax=Apatococcus lobatus TaxID=904363 RepID=A0AAW1RZP2_9CHLO
MRASIGVSLGLLALIGLSLTSLAEAQTTEASPVFSIGYNASRLVMQNVSYSDGTSPLRGFLAYDNSSTAERPVVVIFPDYDGIGPYEIWRAKLFATLGYVAFVGDIFTQNIVQGPSIPVAMRSMLTQIYSRNVPLWNSRMKAALDIAVEQPYADADRVAAVGYCFGGGGVINLMRTYPNVTDGLLGVVGYHPSISIAPIEPNNPIRTLMFYGFDDSASLATRDQFMQSLEAANVTFEFTQFGKTVHAFTEPNLIGSSASASTAYNQVADLMSLGNNSCLPDGHLWRDQCQQPLHLCFDGATA